MEWAARLSLAAVLIPELGDGGGLGVQLDDASQMTVEFGNSVQIFVYQRPRRFLAGLHALLQGTD